MIKSSSTEKALEDEINYFDPDKILLINLALSSIL